VENACKALGFDWEVSHVDMLDYTNPLFKTVYSKMYIDMMTNMPEVLGWLYDQLDKPWKSKRRKLAFDKLHVGPLIRMLEQYRPDVVFCTHSLPAEIISWLRERRRNPLCLRQAVVITDFDVHALWLCDNYEHYFVALEETRVHLEELGMPPEKITVSGIPIDPSFSRPLDKRAMRLKHNLDPDRTTILISAGGYGVGRVESVIALLLRLQHRVQVIAICGKNTSLRHRLEALSADQERHPMVKLKVVGYTTTMHEFMAASDLIVGKPGGMTMCEALASGLGWVIVNPIPGQEERNSDHLLEQGCAIKCNNLPTLTFKVDRLLDDLERVARMQASSRRLARPDAAEVIARTLKKLAEMPPPEPVIRPSPLQLAAEALS
jgi:processive 1,2-diacylglycerol beta-glucosyltransferase